MPVCEASSIQCDGRSLAWFGPEGAGWRVPLERLAVIGEYRAAGDAGSFLALVIDSSGTWLQAPAQASGMGAALEALARALGVPRALELNVDPARAGRVLWPPELAAQPLFEDAPDLDRGRSIEGGSLTERVRRAAQRQS